MSYFKLGPLLVCTFCILSVTPKAAPPLDVGFSFHYDNPGEPVPVPVTEQCERIHITWGRKNARGPNPTAPYSMTVYTSISAAPFIVQVGSKFTFDWDVPFSPGTQYQICMFDRDGVSGGCQKTYTVIRNSTTPHPTCQNVTAPAQLNVLATVPGGEMSQYGFVEQCTDVTITPSSGKPPYTLTVAPSFHPPYNMTSDSRDPISWTVSLSRGFPFFISLISADGQAWSNGPMFSGEYGSNSCLSPGTMPKASARNIAVGAGMGSAFIGIILGVLCCYFFLEYRLRKRARAALERPIPYNVMLPSRQKAPLHPVSNSRERPLPPLPTFPVRVSSSTTLALGTVLSTQERLLSVIQPYTNDWPPTLLSVDAKARSLQSETASGTDSISYESPQRHRMHRTLTFVIHQDAGRAVDSIHTPDDSEIVELPPRYMKATP